MSGDSTVKANCSIGHCNDEKSFKAALGQCLFVSKINPNKKGHYSQPLNLFR